MTFLYTFFCKCNFFFVTLWALCLTHGIHTREKKPGIKSAQET